MFSSEWPVIVDVVADISGELERDTFIDPAITYWSRDEQVFGIPAYIQWIGTAARTLPVGDGTTAYWVDSPAFLRAALDRGEAGWNEETLLEYAQWVKGKYGRFRDDPLLAWQQGAVDALYPVTPYLFKWLKTSAQGTEAEISVVPASSPFGSDSFYYTVPAYLVLAENAPEKAAAVEPASAFRPTWAVGSKDTRMRTGKRYRRAHLQSGQRLRIRGTPGYLGIGEPRSPDSPGCPRLHPDVIHSRRPSTDTRRLPAR